MGAMTMTTISMFKKANLTSQNYNIVYQCEFNKMIETRITIRFMRVGRHHRASYRIIAVDSRKRRDTEPLEFLGNYDPASKSVSIDKASVRKWLSLGARPSKTVFGLLRHTMVL